MRGGELVSSLYILPVDKSHNRINRIDQNIKSLDHGSRG